MRKKYCNNKLFIFFSAFLILSGLLLFNLQNEKVEAAESLPTIAIVGLEHSPFLVGDENEFYISSKNYSGEVQYQIFYTCKELMGNKWEIIDNEDMINGWTKPSIANEEVIVDLTNLDLEPGYYRFAIRVRRTGFKGKYENAYGDYDSAYPFMIDIKEKADINLNGDMIINKTDFKNNEKLIIDGVEGVEGNTEYKLHLYDIKNNKWLGNLTQYDSKVEYDLSNITPGKYLVDIWGRRSDSSKKYEGWKLKVIEVKEEKIPKIAIVGLEHSPYVVGDENEFYIASKNFDGQVQYQLFYTNKEQMGNKWDIIIDENMVDGWTKPSVYNEPVKVDLTNLNLKAGYYRFAIRVRRVGFKGKYENSYGDYDNAYPFMISVLNSSDTKLNGDMLTNKIEFKKNDTLVIDGVQSEEDDTQYKLHLYDVDNNKWLGNLTEYSENIEYDLSNIPEGTYLVDIWSKESNSNRKYDGWKLKFINITSEVNKVTNVNDLKDTIWLDSDYKLPKTVEATFEDGTTYNKAVQWDSEPDTSKEGEYAYEGTLFGYDQKVKLTLNVKNARGNTVGNIINGGLVAKGDGWTYYHNPSDGGRLYKSNDYSDAIVKVSNDIALYINVFDDWIYYANYSEEGQGSIYKIKTDGTERIKLNDDISEHITVENGWIYYANASDLYKLYKIKIDGTGRMKLNDDISLNANVVDGYIYYTNLSDNNRPYKISINGSEKTKISNDEAAFINVVDGWIYYSNMSDENKIYKVKTDGTEKAKITDFGAGFLNVSDGWIYYSGPDSSNRLYKIKTDGTSNTMLDHYANFLIQKVDNYVFYINNSRNDSLYRVKADGSDEFKDELFGVKIFDIPTINKKINYGREAYFPDEVEARMVDGTKKKYSVSWDSETIDTTKAGDYTFEGTVKGYDKKVILNIKVIDIDRLAEEVIERSVTKNEEGTYTPPAKVQIKLADGYRDYVSVNWNPSEISISEVGTYTFEGTIKGFEKKQILKLTVVDGK